MQAFVASVDQRMIAVRVRAASGSLHRFWHQRRRANIGRSNVQLVEMVPQTWKGANKTAYSKVCFYLQEIVTSTVDIAFVLGEACHVQNPHTGAIYTPRS
ncbi:uncharacterized protein ARMOST_15409 [Armillaria ostoyae]|uniref:Uncharacterized protein n=1 Tax=Armillaria ostoyae TaxID=47428 RepID=A0A284RTC3_ARMOS|nr:uncharacterized protein ARMOST_15409 [Armillaria ostoyae]